MLVILLAASLIVNVYLYFGVIRPMEGQENEKRTGAGWVIGGAMDWVQVDLSHGFTPSPGIEFNVSVWGKFWEPDVGSRTYTLYFRIFERPEQNDRYPDEPMAEKLVNFTKGTDEMYIFIGSGDMTVSAPTIQGIYIYEICFGTPIETWKTIEFPLFITYML